MSKTKFVFTFAVDTKQYKQNVLFKCLFTLTLSKSLDTYSP